MNFDRATISEVELRGLRDGLLYAIRKGYLNIMVFCMLVIQAVKDLGSPPGTWSLSLKT